MADQLIPWQRGAPGRWLWVAVVLIAGAGAACAHYQAKPLEPRLSAQQFAERRLSDPRLRDDIGRLSPQAMPAWPPSAWNRGQLLAVALLRNPELSVAQAQVKAVLAHETTAAQAANPELTLQSEYARHDPHPWLYGISLGWLLRSSERRGLDIALAHVDTVNAHFKLMDQTWAVRRALAAALSDAEGARRRLTLLDRLATAQDRLVALETQRIQGGEDPPSELVDSQRARIDVEQQQAEQRAIGAVSQAAAAKALGLPPQALDGIEFSWPDWGEPPPLDDMALRTQREQALLSRADLGIALGEYAAAETRLHQAVARQYPQLVLEPGYYWDHGIAKFPFNVGFTLPLNRNRGEIAEAHADRELAGERMLALQAGMYGEITAAERAEELARAGVDVAERQLQAARKQEQQSELSLRLGAADSLERTGAAIVATRAELEVLQLRAVLQISRNGLEDVLHAPLSGPEVELAKFMAVSAPIDWPEHAPEHPTRISAGGS